MDILPNPQKTRKQVSSQEKMCLRHLEAHPGVSWRDVGARYGWSRVTALNVAKRLVSKGWVTGDLEALTVVAAEPDL